jgi:hypothetical protein
MKLLFITTLLLILLIYNLCGPVTLSLENTKLNGKDYEFNYIISNPDHFSLMRRYEIVDERRVKRIYYRDVKNITIEVKPNITRNGAARATIVISFGNDAFSGEYNVVEIIGEKGHYENEKKNEAFDSICNDLTKTKPAGVCQSSVKLFKQIRKY